MLENVSGSLSIDHLLIFYLDIIFWIDYYHLEVMLNFKTFKESLNLQVKFTFKYSFMCAYCIEIF